MKKPTIIFAILTCLMLPLSAYAAEASVSYSAPFPLTFLFIVSLLLAGRIGALTERFREPAVLGELLVGILLAAIALIPGCQIILQLSHDPLVTGIAEIGILLLLFKTGLESNLRDMTKVGIKALVVASVGVTLPFIGGYFIAKWLLPSLSNNSHLFLGATLTATSVGITTRVFKDLNVLKTIEAKIVLGAAVIDDVLGLLILAIVSGVVSAGHVAASTVIILCVKALFFLGGAIFIGRLIAPYLASWAARIHPGIGMKTALALAFCGGFAYIASAFAGLAPIIGAFAAGLILDPVHFKRFTAPKLAENLRNWAKQLSCIEKVPKHLLQEIEKEAQNKEQTHVENLIEGISHFFVPIFFVYTGLQVNLSVFTDIKTVNIALAVTAIAFLGKLASGYVTGKKINHKLVGFGMVPRGEVGLIFLNVGKQMGVVNNQVFAIGVIMVILTTLLTPPILSMIIHQTERKKRT